MEIQEIESDYVIKNQEAERKFINGLKDKKDLRILEQQYKKEINKILADYSSKIASTLKKHIVKKKKIAKKKEIVKPFKANLSAIESDLMQKLKIKIEVFIFKSEILIKNLCSPLYNLKIIYYTKILKYYLIRIIRKINTFIFRIKNKLIFIAIKFKEFLKYVLENLIGVPKIIGGKIINIFKKNKSDKKSKETSDKKSN